MKQISKLVNLFFNKLKLHRLMLQWYINLIMLYQIFIEIKNLFNKLSFSRISDFLAFWGFGLIGREKTDDFNFFV